MGASTQLCHSFSCAWVLCVFVVYNIQSTKCTKVDELVNVYDRFVKITVGKVIENFIILVCLQHLKNFVCSLGAVF